MKLKKVNSDTAVTDTGQGWFKTQTQERHQFWVQCMVCGKTVKEYWFDWPDKECIVCTPCMEERFKQ